MATPHISCIIPVYKDKYVNPTMQSILNNFTTDFEIIPVLDGYDVPLIEHPRIKPIRLKDRVGMRGAINAGVRAAEGTYLMRSDAHCMFAKGFDFYMTVHMQPNWIMDATRHFLDPVKWQVIDTLEPIGMERLIISERHNKFAASPWRERDDVRSLKPKMAMQGSVWVMPHSWWDQTIKELQVEGYGTLYQDSTEMVMKTWKAGGELMLNTLTWYAHKHREFNRTHDYPNKLSRSSWDYALNTWGEYFRTVVEPRWTQPVYI